MMKGNPKHQSGFTMVELMVATTVGLFLVTGLLSAYLSVAKTSHATPRGDMDEDGDYDKDDRSIDLKHGNIPSQPVVVDTADSSAVVMVGPETLDKVDTGKQVIRTYWYEDILE